MSYEHALKSFDCQSVSFFTVSSFVASVYLVLFCHLFKPFLCRDASHASFTGQADFSRCLAFLICTWQTHVMRLYVNSGQP